MWFHRRLVFSGVGANWATSADMSVTFRRAVSTFDLAGTHVFEP